ncbi:hypothetical protein D3C71_1474360 [compost metagenome]
MLPPEFETATLPPLPVSVEKGAIVSLRRLPSWMSMPPSDAVVVMMAAPPPPPTLCAKTPGDIPPCVAMRPVLFATVTAPAEVCTELNADGALQSKLPPSDIATDAR